MEIQRNKRLNWVFIVLAVLAVVLRLVSMFLGNMDTGIIFRDKVHCLLSLACAVLPILAIVCSRRKAVSLTLSIVYFAVWAFMTYLSAPRYSNYRYLWGILLLNADGIVYMFMIGFVPLFNIFCKMKDKKGLGFACIFLGGLETASIILLHVWQIQSFYWDWAFYNIKSFYTYYDYYDYYYYANFYLPYYLSYCVLLFAIGAGILRDVPAQIEKSAKIENPTAQKSKQTALFLSIFTGVLGVDRFYLGYTALGVLKLLTAGGAGIWALIDFIRIGVDSLRPSDGSPWVEETRDENIRAIAANMQAIAERLEKLQAQNVPAEAEKPQTDGENQETHKVSLKK